MNAADGEAKENVTVMEGAALREYLAVLDPYFEAEGVTEVVINRPGEVWTEGRGGWQKHEAPKLTFSYCMQVAKLIANYDQQAINAANPMLSAMLPGGMRVQVMIPPCVEHGTVGLTIRRPMATTRPLHEYTVDGSFGLYEWGRSAEMDERLQEMKPLDRVLVKELEEGRLEDFLRDAIRGKKNIAVIGDTGSGKTTLMKSMCEAIPMSERLVTIEDVRELFLPHPNRQHLLYSSTGKGAASTTPATLIKSCMRLKPDRVLLAELRGSEAFDFLNLLTTGHSGSITSFHAENCAVGLERYVFMCKEHEKAAVFDSAGLKRLVAMTIDVILHMTAEEIHDKDGHFAGKKRYVTEVHFDPVAKLAARFGTARVVRTNANTRRDNGMEASE